MLAWQRTPCGSRRAMAAPSAHVSEHTRSTALVKTADIGWSPLPVISFSGSHISRFRFALGIGGLRRPGVYCLSIEGVSQFSDSSLE